MWVRAVGMTYLREGVCNHMKLSAAIMAHPARKDHVDSMVEALDVNGRKFTVTWDEHGEGLWANARQAWMSYDPAADYHLVLQDDVLPCRDLLAGTENAIEMLAGDPGSCLSLFCGYKDTEHAINDYKTWVWSKVAASAQALAIPTDAIDDWLDWCDVNVDPLCFTDDYRLSMYMLATNRKMYYTAPSLVEHVGHDRSLLGQIGKKQIWGVRMASVFLGEDSSASEIDWDPVNNARRVAFGNGYFYEKWYMGPGKWSDVLKEQK